MFRLPSTQHPHPILLCVIALGLISIVTTNSAIAQNEDALWVPGEYIVKYDDERIDDLRRRLPDPNAYSNDEIKEVLTEIIGARKVGSLDLIDADKVKATSGDEINPTGAVELLDANLIDYLSPNYIRTINRTPNDPYLSDLWGLSQANNVDIDAQEAWDVMPTDGASDVVVGIVDTGIDYNHPDLAGNMWHNPAEAAGQSGIDDDGNGVVDDIYGFNAVSNNGTPLDDHSHGTHVAGTIGAVANNGIGVVGVAWKVKLMALKFLSSSGSGTDWDAIEAISYAVSMRNRGGHLKVLNNSWGGSGYDAALKNAIHSANEAGILFVAAAGNAGTNNDVSPFYPANYDEPNLISVAAIGSDGSKASFSCYGPTTVHLAAPGVSILSSVPNGNYARYSGTSMATPHVSGVAALAYSKMLQYTPAETKAMLMATVKPLPALNGLMVSPGVVSARNALANPSNFGPELQQIEDQTISGRTRIKTVPLLAIDREGDRLTFSANIVVPHDQAAAASADQLYNLSEYLLQYDNYYRLGEKHLLGASNRRFMIFPSGLLAELQYPYYYPLTTVDLKYYTNPLLLVNAYPPDLSAIATVTLINGDPTTLRIEVAQGFLGTFSVSVSVTDGNRTDSEEFLVKVTLPDGCS
jgi:subtilisin family serine protease